MVFFFNSFFPFLKSMPTSFFKYFLVFYIFLSFKTNFLKPGSKPSLIFFFFFSYFFKSCIIPALIFFFFFFKLASDDLSLFSPLLNVFKSIAELIYFVLLRSRLFFDNFHSFSHCNRHKLLNCSAA